MTVEEQGPLDPNYSRSPPADGLIVRVNGRILDKLGFEICKATCDFTGGDKASRDFLWLRAEDLKAMAPSDSKVGYSYAMPRIGTERIARFHLIDNTRGEPDFWKKDDIRKNEMTFTVLSATKETIELSLTGKVLLADHAELDQSKRGYDCTLSGRLTYDVAKKSFKRFDIAALGDFWGSSTFTKQGVRPGKSLFGIAFGLPPAVKPGDRVPPQGARELSNYWGK